MKGLCVSKGSVRGKAIIVDSVFATKTIAPGTILVMKTLDRKLLVSLSKNVVGVIAESGNIGSHSAGILRSLKIPCVLRIKDAVSIINDGQEIVIEGEKGEVHWCENEISQGKTAIHSQHGAIYKSIATEKFEVTDISVNREWYCPRPERAYQKLRFDIIAPVFGKSGKFLFGLPEATVVQNSFGAIVVKGAPLNVDICKFVLKNPEWLFQKSHERERVIQEIRSTLGAIEIKENSDSTKYYLDIIKIGIKLYRQLFLYSLMSQAISDELLDAYVDFESMITGNDTSRDILGLTSIYVENCIKSKVDPGVSQRWRIEKAYPHIWDGTLNYDKLRIDDALIQRITMMPNSRNLLKDYESFRIIVPLVYQLSEEYFYTSSSINSYINWGLLGIARCVGKNDGKGVDEIYNLPLESLLKIEGGK